MRDEEQEYPRHQPGRGEPERHNPFDTSQDEGELEEGPRRRGSPVHQREAATMPELPHGYASKALIVGIIAGVLCSVQGIILTLANASSYTTADKYLGNPNAMPSAIAFKLVGLFFLGVLISAVIYFIAGLITGKIAVQRRWAFIGGFAGGVVSSIIGDVLKLIPTYPNAGNTGLAGGLLGAGSGIVALLIGFILLGVLAGLVSWFGARLITRHHPYYVGYSG